MTYVYILISNKEDFVKEQALISIYSLKKYNKEANVILLVDETTYHYIINEGSNIKEYVNEIKILDLPNNLSSIQRSRFIKTSIPEFISDDFIYIDNDTVIVDSLIELEKSKCDIGAILTQHRNDWSPNLLHPMIKEYQKITGLKAYSDYFISNYLFNGGILVCKQTEITKKFFSTWHQLWYNDSLIMGFDKDQISLWRTNYKFNNLIHLIDPSYNCQLIYPNQAKYILLNAKILHYFSSCSLANHLKIKNKEFLKGIRNNGLNETVDEYIVNFKSEYLKGMLLLMDDDKESYNKPINVFGRKINRDFPSFNRFIRNLYKIFGFQV